ncbi:MAG: apolipoprotein N-acyltransferase [Pseudonocardiales bacterium]|nr:MAG: apolipoprotein N-acyltransferase [Pseudonocardiales bacterium]
MLTRRTAAGPGAAVVLPPIHIRWAALLAVGAGVLGVLAFPRFGFWPLAFLSVGAFSLAVHGRRSRTGAWLGLLYGLAFFGPLLHWTGVYVGPVPWLLLALSQAAFLAGLGAALPLVQRLPAAPAWTASLWVLQEAVRDRLPFGGFPWGRLAFSQAQSPLRWFAALGGAPLVTFAVALAGAALFAAVPHAVAARWRPLAPATAVLIAVPVVGAVLAWPLAPAADRDATTSTVALIQGSVPELGLAFEERARQVLDNHIAQTAKLAAEIKAGTVERPSLVVWPEDASDVDPFQDAIAYRAIDAAVKAIDVPVLVGAILQGPGPHRRNAGILWSPTSGPGDTYVKRHPVPFGEYIPLRSLAEFVSSDAKLVSEDMVGGHGSGLVSGGPYPIGDVICFEIGYDGLVRSSVAAGARLVVVQTNNATFGHTAETYQQLAMSQLRAVENGRTVLQVATTGVSAVIGPDGGIRQRSAQLFSPAVIVARVPLRTATTPATRLGVLPEYLLAALALAALAYTIRPERRSARPAAAPDPEEVVRT